MFLSCHTSPVWFLSEDENHHHGEHEGKKEEFINREEYASIVDNILEDDDLDKDGYINWFEFKRRQKQQGWFSS